MKIRNMELGQGVPKVCIPLTSRSLEELRSDCENLRSLPFDMIEWRIDCLLGMEGFDPQETLQKGFTVLRTYFPDTVLLATVRTQPQGGAFPIRQDAYWALLREILEIGKADILDIEYGHAVMATVRLLSLAKSKHIPVLTSFHRFSGPMKEEELLTCYDRMKELGGDILKIAVLPQTPLDVCALLRAAALTGEKYPDTPVIAIGMGRLGMLTRLAGNSLGSPLTFASAREASAPGQLSAEDAGHILDCLYKEP